MGRKTDLVVWLKLTALQRHIYEAFLHSDAVKAALNSSKSPLAALTVLKKVCDHPALLSERATKLVVEGRLGCLRVVLGGGVVLAWPHCCHHQSVGGWDCAGRSELPHDASSS